MTALTDTLREALLSNPYWSALCTEQAHYAIGGPLAKRFAAEVIPFAGVAHAGPDAADALRALLAPGESIYVTSDVPLVFPGLTQVLEFAGVQMIWPEDQPIGATAETVLVEPLGDEHIPEMIALKAIAFPGYFGPRAASLGSFFGIRAEGALVAMAGERLRLPGMCEISAVCTHPGHLGKGFAAALIRHLLRAHAAENTRSFLQATARNARAIALYERLGFVKTRGLVWRELRRDTL
jgi:ribosomal protein S18 acetylase RimI-like enzyme